MNKQDTFEDIQSKRFNPNARKTMMLPKKKGQQMGNLNQKDDNNDGDDLFDDNTIE